MSTVDHRELLSAFLRVWKFHNTMLGKIKFKYKIIIKGRRAGTLAGKYFGLTIQDAEWRPSICLFIFFFVIFYHNLNFFKE